MEDGRDLRAGEAFIAGVAAMLLPTALLGVAHLVQASLPFPALGLAQRVVELIPGTVAVFFIERLGHWALRLFAGGFAVGSVLVGGLAGIVVARQAGSRRLLAIAGAAAVLGAVALGGYRSGPGAPAFTTYVVVVALAGLVFALSLRGSLDRLERDRVPPPARGLGRTRREVLRAGAGAAGLLAAGLALRALSGGGLGDRGGQPLTRPAGAAPVEPAVPPPDGPQDTAFHTIQGLTPEITPNHRHYVVDESIIDPDVDPGSWELRIDGLVGSPTTLGYDELLSLPAIEQYVTMQCISNEVGGDLVGTAKWTGVPLAALLARAGGPSGRAVRVVFHAVGGYTDSLPVAKAMDGATVVAYGMNGRTLPRAHGYPARIIAPGIYGMKSVKWLQRIEVVDYDYKGYWQRDAGWDNLAVIKTASRIDVPEELAAVKGEATVAGVAWAGERGIDRVEVSADGGRTWMPATLRRQLSRTGWRQWRLRWRPSTPGETDLQVRAFDGQGKVQTAEEAPPHPSGASGYDHTKVVAGDA
jgi:DMSO/TMAO reductase YedYZ molybdopterin-dependent catalytic subunit